MSLREHIESKLNETFSPVRLNVIDESHMHAGHQPGITGTGETHMRVQIVSESFSGKSRVDRHRAVNALLKPELDAGLHALAIEVAAPGEPTRF
ncbi:BolA family protein [Agrobacterium sp. BA1120]|uniref:BolA family protein n=1 Tax=Agrobacterium sp. BA1120 TaxID=3228927 RepID=UPI003369EAF5